MIKKIFPLVIGLLTLSLPAGYGQPTAVAPAAQKSAAPELTQFNLNFPGGRPTELVQAIEKAMGKSLNVIINREDDDVNIPPLQLNGVTLPQLFAALETASRRFRNTGYGMPGTDSYGFKTTDSPISDATVWCFYVVAPDRPRTVAVQKECAFYSLAEDLDRGITVDDITTAIQTGWKLEGIASPPELNYHKETKILIAYGEPDQLTTIGQVLRALPAGNRTSAPAQTDQLKAQIKELQQEVEQLKQPHAAGTAAGVGTGAGMAEEKAGK